MSYSSALKQRSAAQKGHIGWDSLARLADLHWLMNVHTTQATRRLHLLQSYMTVNETPMIPTRHPASRDGTTNKY
jgi:hypothetical protein